MTICDDTIADNNIDKNIANIIRAARKDLLIELRNIYQGTENIKRIDLFIYNLLLSEVLLKKRPPSGSSGNRGGAPALARAASGQPRRRRASSSGSERSSVGAGLGGVDGGGRDSQSASTEPPSSVPATAPVPSALANWSPHDELCDEIESQEDDIDDIDHIVELKKAAQRSRAEKGRGG